MENIKDFDTNNPSIYYHEQMTYSYVPLGYRIKKNIISLLRKIEPKKALPESIKKENVDSVKNEFRDSIEKVNISVSVEKETETPTKSESENELGKE